LYKVTERQTSIEIIGKHEMNLPVYMARGHLFTSQVKIRYQSAIVPNLCTDYIKCRNFAKFPMKYLNLIWFVHTNKITRFSRQ
jgi:hypothetical protein